MQDIAVLPHLPDPSLNTVECVIVGDEKAQRFDGPKKLFHGVCWSILCISLFVGQLASQWLIMKLGKWKETPENDSKVATVMFLSLFVFALAFGLHIFALVSHRDVYSCTFFAFVVLVLFRRACWCIHKRRRMRRTNTQCILKRFDCSLTKGNDKKTSTNIISCFILYPAVFMACHHLLWILLGVITEPFWGISVLAAVLSVSAVFCFLFYDFRTHFSSFECDRKCLIALFLDLGGFFAFLLLIFELLVVGQSFLSESLITTLVQNILVVFATLAFRYVKLDPKTETEDDEGENGEQMELQQEAGE